MCSSLKARVYFTTVVFSLNLALGDNATFGAKEG